MIGLVTLCRVRVVGQQADAGGGEQAGQRGDQVDRPCRGHGPVVGVDAGERLGRVGELPEGGGEGVSGGDDVETASRPESP